MVKGLEVEVRFFALVRERAGLKEERVELPEGSSMNDLIEVLVGRHPGLGEYIFDNREQIRDFLSFSVNNVDIWSLDGFDTRLRDGDRVFLIPPLGGG